MYNIVTAIGNPEFNNIFKIDDKINIIKKDIQYQEGVLELLERENNIDYLIISELIPGMLKFDLLIEKILEINKNIKLIIILENPNNNLEKYYYKIGVEKIFYNNQNEIKEIINYINNDKNNFEIKKEIKEIKQIINNNKKVKIKNININYIKNIIRKNNKKEKSNDNKIITISGTTGIGKSIFTIILSKILQKNYNKILIIDFDFLNNDISTILGIKKYSNKIKNKINNNKINYKNLIININKKIDLISGINIILNKENNINEFEFKRIFFELKNNYDLIIIDSSTECFLEYNKKIFNESNLILFLMEGNLLEIKKSKRLLDIFNNEWNISNNKIKIIINKYNKYSIDMKTIKLIFEKYEIYGKIDFNNYYNFIINKNAKNSFINKNIKKNFIKINKKIIQNKKIKRGGIYEFFINIRKYRKQFN